MTKAQKQALQRAAEFGNAWSYSRCGMFAWTSGRSRCINALKDAGLLTRDAEITEAGRAALA